MTTQCLPTDFNQRLSAATDSPQDRSPIHRLFTWWISRRQQRDERVALKELSSLDDAMLKDIGISRNDVVWASQLPQSVNASIELEIIARRRSGHS
jgi:uncharacterized protein YjiS (DUF1127 family)